MTTATVDRQFTEIELPPKLYPGASFEHYQHWNAVNPSLAKHGRMSMKALKDATTAPIKAPTPAMIFGSACHCCVLEPDEFPRRYILWDGGDKRGKAWDAFCAANVGRIALKHEEYSACLKIRDEVRSHPAVKKYLSPDADVELSMIWNDHTTGIRCKGRPDYVSNVILDLKFTNTLEERLLQSTGERFGYHISLAAYQDGYSTLTGRIMPAVLVFAQATRPHDVIVRPVPNEVLIKGFDQWVGLLGKIQECRATGKWPGISDEEFPYALPAYAMADDEDLGLTFGGESLKL